MLRGPSGARSNGSTEIPRSAIISIHQGHANSTKRLQPVHAHEDYVEQAGVWARGQLWESVRLLFDRQEELILRLCHFHQSDLHHRPAEISFLALSPLLTRRDDPSAQLPADFPNSPNGRKRRRRQKLAALIKDHGAQFRHQNLPFRRRP